MHQYIVEIREFVNQPRVQHRLMRNLGKWLQLCACMDTIEDTDSVLASYQAREYADTQGGRYLALYGLLQAVYLQQDAVRNLCEALDMPVKTGHDDRLKTIREIRNDTVGHPTKRDRPKGQPKAYVFVPQVRIQHGSFERLTFKEDGSTSYESVAVPELLADQHDLLSAVLGAVVAKLKSDDQAHKDRFKMDKLADLFSAFTSYEVEKLFEGVFNPDKGPFSRLFVGTLRKRLHELEEALAKRDTDLDAYDSLAHAYKYTSYALDMLEAYFQSPETGTPAPLDPRGAYIFATYVSGQIGEIREMAQELDEYYAR